MFLQKRVIHGKTYTYVDHSFRIGKKVQKVSFILDRNKENYNEIIIKDIAVARAAYFKEQCQTYFSLPEIIEIETEKVFYQIFFQVLNSKSKQEILTEFIRLFLANSMELEGSTITPKIAEQIEQEKKNLLLPESDIQLYHHSKTALFNTLKKEFRSVIQFKHLHKEIYEGIYPHAGEFKTQENTFGYIEKAITTPPKEVRKELQAVLERYKEKKVYPFLKPFLFQMQYQKIHPFTDGNSRLGRILLVAQMFKINYPPLIFKGDMSFQIRETLVEYCNHNQEDFCRLAMEQYVQTSQKFWRPMIKKFLFYSK